MQFKIDSTYKFEVLVKRLAQIFGTDCHLSEEGANIEGFISIGSGNNLAVKKVSDKGDYIVWYRYGNKVKNPDFFGDVINHLI